MYKKNNSQARRISYGGITSLLNVFSLYLASTLPTNRVFFFGLSTVFLVVMVIEFGVKASVATFIASTILGAIVIPNKLTLVPYVVFFGYYAILKYYIEKLNNLFLEWALKLLGFNIAIIISYVILSRFLFNGLEVNIPIPLIIVILQLIFIIYDIVYSMAIGYYTKRLKHILKH